MKHLWLTLILLFLTTSIWTQIYTEKPKGPVKESVEKSYNNIVEKGKIIPEKPIYDQLYIYNIEGNEIDYIEFHNKGELWQGHKYTYDKNGKKLGKYAWCMGDSTRITWTDSIIYDTLKNQITILNYSMVYGFESTTILQLNNKNQITTEKWQKPDNSITRSITYAYDKNGNKIKETVKDIERSYPYENIYRFNMRGELIYYEHGQYGYRHYYVYTKRDKFGNWLRRIQKSNPKSTYVYVTDRTLNYYSTK